MLRFLLLTALPLASMLALNALAGDPASVTVKRFVLAYQHVNTNYWRLSLTYNFPGQNRVVLEGVGEVAPAGELTFLTTQRELRFLDASGRLLKAVTLERTGTPEGAGVELPSDSDLGSTYQSFTRRREFLPNECDTVLNKFFNSGYTMRREGTNTVYTTAYQSLREGVQGSKRAQIALQISSPYPAPQSQIAFRVRQVVRERGRGEGESDWIYAPNIAGETQHAAASFCTKVVQKLQEVE
jgi:hypothetical protein